ncbi:MAG: hypothetical protein ACYC4L_13950 [Chloroflexota bacterium]
MAIMRGLRDLRLVMALWAVVALIALVWRGTEALALVGLCAGLNALLSRWLAARTWEGTVERLEMRRLRQQTADDSGVAETRWVERLMADVRRADGTLITVPASHSWQVGERIVGLRGEPAPDNGPGMARA